MHLILVLIEKEWMRLKKNPAALMAAGLIILMAMLVSIENKASQKAKRLESSPCLLVYQDEDDFIQYIKKTHYPKVLQFKQTQVDLQKTKLDYPPTVRCAIEVSPVFQRFPSSIVEKDAGLISYPMRNITLRIVDAKNDRYQRVYQWVLARLSEYKTGGYVNEATKPMKDKAPTKTLGSIDLGSRDAKAMVGAMLLFSAQYFLACALFISFTAHERERGILQSLALTTVSVKQMLWAKLLFHSLLSYIASILIYSIISQQLSWVGDVKLLIFVSSIFILSGIGLFSIATIITCFNRNQTSASMMGFCYIMLMGVIFSLSTKFHAFAIIKAFMFESHSISLFNALLNARSIKPTVFIGHYLDLMVLTLILLAIAQFIWKRRGWRTL